MILVDCINKREITQLRHTFSSEIKNILEEALSKLWSVYDRDPIFSQMLSYVKKIGTQEILLSEAQLESLIPQVSLSIQIFVVNHHKKDRKENLMIIETDGSSDSSLLHKQKLLQLYESCKGILQEAIQVEKTLGFTENQYKSPQFHQTQNQNQQHFFRNGQENMLPANYQTTYASSFPSHSKINNKPQEHFVNMNQSRKH